MESFIMGGFECTYAKVGVHTRLDLLASTQHDVRCRDDYRLLDEIGIETVREGLSWSQVDRGNGVYDFDRFEAMMAIGQETGVQQIWDLNHFDYPDYLDPYSDEFVQAFGTYSKHAIKLIRKYTAGTIYLVPLNEISFFAWIAADQGVWAPFNSGDGWGFRFKKQLVRAAIAAMDAIWEEDADVRFIHTDPFMRRLAMPPTSPAANLHVQKFNDVIRFEAWDMLAGKTHPEAGGDPRYLDIIGVNYYLHNQEWVSTDGNAARLRHRPMDWHSKDRIPFSRMLSTIYRRYHRPLIVTETGSYGQYRERWLKRTFTEVLKAKAIGLPVGGVCIYPVLDRLNSVNYLFPESGIWDFDQSLDTCNRIPHKDSIKVIRYYAKRFESDAGSSKETLVDFESQGSATS